MTATPRTDPALEALLAERPADASDRARRALAEATGGLPVVLRGAGGAGRDVLAALRRAGTEPLCFCDDALAGQTVDGLLVLDCDEAIASHGETAAFVVTIMHPRVSTQSVVDELRDAGAATVLTWVSVGWSHPEGLLPRYPVDLPQNVLGAGDDIRAAYALLADDASRDEFRRQLAWRLTGDFAVLGPPLPVSEQYFSDDVIQIGSDEVFVDCGAFDGDTLRSLVAHAPDGFGRVVALEPDPANLAALGRTVASLPAGLRERVEVLPWAVGADHAVARWGGEGTAAAGISDQGTLEVTVAPIDALLDRGITATYLKMDIEGAEPDALAGAETTIVRHRPALAICVYHVQSHLWEIPLQIAAMVDDYRYILRRYEQDGFDVVLYAIPAER